MDNLSDYNYVELDNYNEEYNFRPITKHRIKKDILNVYEKFCPPLIANGINISEAKLEELVGYIIGDLYERVRQDPIAFSQLMVYEISKSFKVIFFYRISHFIFNMYTDYNKKINKLCAFKISEYAAVTCGIEIHPQAKIGKRFVIDHGINTLIGATAEIGDNCTILQNVVLGARKITFNKQGKRHPTLGNNVHISGGVRILGPISIGNNVKIYPDCVITKDIKDNTKVMLKRVLIHSVNILDNK